MIVPILALIFISLIVAALFAFPIIIFIKGKRRNWHWIYRSFSLIPLLAVILFLYFQFRTPESFYHGEYETITHTKFPESGEIQYSTVSSVAFNGDYASAFMAELDLSDIRTLKKSLLQNGFKNGKDFFLEELDKLESKFGSRDYSEQFTLEDGETQFVGFLDDNKTVVFARVVY